MTSRNGKVGQRIEHEKQKKKHNKKHRNAVIAQVQVRRHFKRKEQRATRAKSQQREEGEPEGRPIRVHEKQWKGKSRKSNIVIERALYQAAFPSHRPAMQRAGTLKRCAVVPRNRVLGRIQREEGPTQIAAGFNQGRGLTGNCDCQVTCIPMHVIHHKKHHRVIYSVQK